MGWFAALLSGRRLRRGRATPRPLMTERRLDTRVPEKLYRAYDRLAQAAGLRLATYLRLHLTKTLPKETK